jgi:ligand-binding sensor domain-containing protein
LWRPDERVLLSDFSFVGAIAASPWYVFAATRHGLTVYDRRAHRWQLPVTPLDGYPGVPVRIALADGVDDAVWIGADDGWYRYDLNLRRWDHGIVPGGVRGFVLDAQDLASGIWMLQGLGGWAFLPRGGFTPIPGRPLPPPNQRVQPLDPRVALAQAPAADALRALILTDTRLRTYQFTCAARTPDQNELWFGTSGMGIVRMDAATAEWETLSYGLLGPRADALAPGPDGVWVTGTARVGERRGLTWVPGDLTDVRPLEAAVGAGFPYVAARRLLAAEGGRTLWLATDGGVLRIDARSGVTRRFDVGSGLPSETVFSLGPAADGVWVGTAAGLAVVTADERVARVGMLDRAVLSLLAVRDTLWVGSRAGLGVLPPGAGEPVVPPEVAAQPALLAPVVALSRVGDTLVAATPDQLAWRDPATRAWTVLRPRADLGAVTALAGDPGAGGAWIAGTGGLAFWSIARGTFHMLRVAVDLPGAVRDVLVSGDYVWAATDSGLVRLAHEAALGR